MSSKRNSECREVIALLHRTLDGDRQAHLVKAREALLNLIDVEQVLSHLIDGLIARLRILLECLPNDPPEGLGQHIDLRLCGQVLHQDLAHA